MFITADLFFFALLFNIFIWERLNQAQLFETSRQLLNPNIGLLNTFFLLTSSWFMVRAVRSARAALRIRLVTNILVAVICGVGFAVSKLFEYNAKLHSSITILTNDFFQYYFIFTGFHFFHVLIGLIALVVLLNKARTEVLDERYLFWIETGASYWHMVDLLWLMLFPLLYLMRA